MPITQQCKIHSLDSIKNYMELQEQEIQSIMKIKINDPQIMWMTGLGNIKTVKAGNRSFCDVTIKEFQRHSCRRSGKILLKWRSGTTLSERQRAGRLECSGCPEVLARISCIPLGLGKSKVSFKTIQSLPWLSPGFCLCNTPSNLLPGFSNACALTYLIFSQDFPRLWPGHCMVTYFGSSAHASLFCFVIWLLHMHLIKGMPLIPSWLLLYMNSVKRISPGHFLPPPINPVEHVTYLLPNPRWL